MTNKTLAIAAVLATFTVYSLWVVAGHGYFGFLAVARDNAWGLQMLLDLALACSIGVHWMRGDARRRGIATTWPFAIATLAFGSIGLLGYVVYRDVAGQKLPVASPAI